MVSSLTDCYLRLGFQVTESEEGLRIGFKPGMVHAIVKEVRNERPLTRSDAELFYEKFSTLSKGHRNLYFRIVAHGGFLRALDFELHGLTVSDESYIESLLSGRHVELYPHNEAAYRAIMRGFKQHRIGAVVQATGTGKSYLLARYIADHAKEKILVFAPNITILDEIRKAVGFSIPQVTYRTFQSLIRNREDNGLLRADHILIDEFHHFGAEIWGSALQEVIENNPCAYVLGTSATPIRPEGMIDTVDLYFEGNLFYELTLPQAWYYNILPVRFWYRVFTGWTTNWTGCKESWNAAVVQKDEKKRYRRNWIWHVWISKRLWGHRKSSGSSCRQAYASCWYSVAISPI